MKKLSFVFAISSVILAGLFLPLLFSCKKEAVNNIPTVTVVAVNNITETSATSGGEITSDGGAEVTARGVCWSVNKNPTTADKKTIDGTGSGSFASSITELTPGTDYNIRAYAINAVGTAYSSQATFNALASKVVLTTASLSAVTTTSAVGGGNISTDGGATVTARGVCWSTSAIPTIDNSKTTDGIGPGLYTSSISGLTPNTAYHIRAYAINNVGTAYGDEIILKTFTGTVTDIDENVYNTVTIVSQVWMAENLKTTKYNDGTDIPLVNDAAAWNALTTPGYCWLNNDKAANKATYGALYNYYVVDVASNGNKNVCPTGWHVPTNGEWTDLTTSLGGEPGAGGKLKEAGTAHWQTPNTGATNETGFTVLPAGGRGFEFGVTGTDGNFWTSTEYETHSAWVRFISFSNSNVHTQFTGKLNGNSIRCLKN
ncbi:MAG: fibrobacter succinogenes major paralogous domain-containing protein [Bacteroidota bacterium]